MLVCRWRRRGRIWSIVRRWWRLIVVGCWRGWGLWRRGIRRGMGSRRRGGGGRGRLGFAGRGGAGVGALAAGDPAADVLQGQVAGGKVAFVFPGQGAQWERMAVELLESSPVFAQEITACGEALSRYVDWRLEDVLRGAAGAPSLDRVDVVQPVLFAVMVALAGLWRALGVEPGAGLGGSLGRVDVVQAVLFAVMVALAGLWRSFGVEPTAVLGHSQGEIAAAYVAGGLSLDDAARVVALRSRVVGERLAVKGDGEVGGAMVSVALPAARGQEQIESYGGRVSVAAVNGPAAAVVSGEPGVLDELLAAWERDGVRARRVPVDYASHSVQVEAIREELPERLGPIAPRSGGGLSHLPSQAGFIDTAGLDAGYWYRNLRAQVGFEPAVRALVGNGVGCFVEISPHPVLTMAMHETIQAVEGAGRVGVVGSLRRDQGGPERFAMSLAEAHVAGVSVDWRAFYAGSGARVVPLPTYAFQRQRY